MMNVFFAFVLRLCARHKMLLPPLRRFQTSVVATAKLDLALAVFASSSQE